ncbi:unnamed protein product [Jaminaea pallidilutea]
MSDSQPSNRGKRPSQGQYDRRDGKFARGRGRGSGRGRGYANGVSSRATPAAEVDGQDQSATIDGDAGSGTVTPASDAPNKTAMSHLSDVRFSSLAGSIDSRILSAIKFEFMSNVQAATINDALSGVDLLAQAKTGTGKTIAFLLPAIQRLLNTRRRQGQIYTLILSPTRELAIQIQREAQMVLANVPDVGVQHVVGGTNMTSEQRRLRNERCDILVATPGRLVDHLDNSGLANQLSEVQTFVLDEADRMLDMGFKPQLEQIKARLPNPNVKPRQSLLFSATFPKTILEMADVRQDHRFINTIPESEQNTHQHVDQVYQVVPMPEIMPLILSHILQERSERTKSAKVIVFLPTARATQTAFEAMKDHPAIGRTWEIHSRKSQSQRAKASEEFRKAAQGVLFSSDVAARGVDFPDVTVVIQAGLPSSPDQYIHRLGRTARAGASGRGILLLADFETYFLSLREIKALPLKAAQDNDPRIREILEKRLPANRADIERALTTTVSDESKSQTYQAMLGYYNSSLRALKWDKPKLVQMANEYARSSLRYAGPAPPPLLAKTVGKMGLKGVPGLNIVRELPGMGGGRGGGGGGGGARGGAARGGGGPDRGRGRGRGRGSG